MSNWMKLKTQIKNLDSFKKACEELNISYEENILEGGPLPRKVVTLVDREKSGPRYSRIAHMCREKDHYIIEGDTDLHYSSLARRLGSDYGLLMQAYAKHEVLHNVQMMGGVCTEQKQTEDGSLVLRVSI